MRAVAIVPLLLGLLGSFAPAAAETDRCEPPISVCRVLAAEDGVRPPMPFEQACPDGHECVCVPSCPECDDCAAQVCVPGESEPECKTACDCPTGLGCFDGQCIAGFAPVYCCDSDTCPAGNQCQGRDGEMGRCEAPCTDTIWSCDGIVGDDSSCSGDRVCGCTASCPGCEDCGPPVCAPSDLPTPYACDDDESCANPGDRCVCVPSCPTCRDCSRKLCVPDRCDPPGPTCAERAAKVAKKIERLAEKANECRRDRDCVFVDTSTECQGACGAFIHRRFEQRFERKLEKLDARVCDGYQEEGCPFVTPLCLQLEPKCDEGRCVGVPNPVFRR